MSIEARDVIEKKGHRFKDTGEVDLKFSRSCLVILAQSGESAYYLTLATHENTVMETYQRYTDSNYLLKKKRCEGLKKTSLVNLKLIYKGRISGKLVVVVPSDEYGKLIRKFIKWQEKNPDELYDEVKPMLEGII